MQYRALQVFMCGINFCKPYLDFPVDLAIHEAAELPEDQMFYSLQKLDALNQLLRTPLQTHTHFCADMTSIVPVHVSGLAASTPAVDGILALGREEPGCFDDFGKEPGQYSSLLWLAWAIGSILAMWL